MYKKCNKKICMAPIALSLPGYLAIITFILTNRTKVISSKLWYKQLVSLKFQVQYVSNELNS